MKRPERSASHGALRTTVFALAIALGHSESALADEAAATTTEPSPVAVSERRAAEAFQAYTRKEYPAAVALYLEAYDAAPSGSILYNIARIYDLKLADRPLAISYYRRYIADPGAYTERIEVANQRLSDLREAELSASKVKEPEPALGALTQQEPGDTASRRPLSETSDGRRGTWSTLRWTGAALGAVGLVGVGVGAGFGLAAMSKAGTASDACDGNRCTSQEGVDAANAAATTATISTVGFTAGGALLLTGAALFILGDNKPEQSPRTNIRVDTAATASGVSLALTGKW